MAFTIREYLGDEKIAQLESMGFLPSLITDMAIRQYAADKQAKRNELSDAGLDGKLVQGIMRGEISEEEARNAQKFEDFGAKKHGWGLGAVKTVAGIANAAERVSDLVNPFHEGKRDEKGDYVYQNAIEKGLRPKIKSAEKLRDDYEKATGETSWGSRAAEIGTEMVADPINFVGGMGLLSKGSKLAQFGKKSLYFAGTGAASGGVMALGEGKNDEETLKNMGYGAAGGFVLGHAIDQGIQGIGKLIAKHRASKATNEADAIEHAENSDFLSGGAGGATRGELKTAQTMTAREFATREVGLDEETAAKVVKEAAQGKEKSDFTSEETYADIVEFKNFENQREAAKAYGEQIEAAKASLNNAREQSAVRYSQTQKAINEYQKQGMSASATRELINAKFKPGADEINYTRAYNDGADVDPRLVGQGIFYALEKDIAAQAYAPEIYAARLKQRGFSDESAQAFTQAYVQKNINIAKDYANGKAAEVYENDVRMRVAAEIKAKNEVESERAPIEDANSFLKESAKHKASERERMSGAYPASDASDGHIMKDGTAAKPEIYEGDGIIDFSSKIDDDLLRANATELEPSSNLFDFLAKTKNNPSRDKILNHFADKAGEGDSKALDHRMVYLNYIMPTIEEPLIKIFRPDGRISNIKPFVFTNVNSKTKNVNFLSIVTDKDGNIDFITAYALKDKSQLRSEIKKGIKVEVRRGLARTFDPHSRVQVPSATEEIIPQKGNLVNEAETNGLRDSVSSIGDNASRAGGRQAGDEQILRQSGRNTPDSSQTKRPTASDEQVEQQWAAKADGETDAAASIEQVVEKQGSGASIGGGLSANSNAHLGSGLVAGTLNSQDEDGNFSPKRFAAGFLAGLAGGKAVVTGLRKMTPKLYNQILGAAEKMPQMANSNPRLLGRLYSNGKDVSLNSFAGEKAITANVGKLDQAKAMLEKGADEVEIWQKTGWFKDKDGAWKFEIDDSSAKLNPNFQSGGRLGELLEHEELFKAYPELKDVRVVKIGDETPDGAALSVRDAAQKEKRGIYNVTYNDKTATFVRQDLDDINSALLYERGDKEVGAKHTRIRHLRDENKVGYVKDTELLNLGENIRAFTKKYEEPFIDKRGARIYEWQDENGVRFRVVVDNRRGNGQTPPPASESIITFYSDRNLKDRMDFKNPKVKYDVNLKEWHKDSAPITKNSDGSPKVFYHGSKAKDITEFKDKFDKSGYGFWFNQSKSAAVEFKQDGKIYQVYINVKNPIDLSFPYSQKAKNLFDEAERLGIDTELYPENQSDAFKKFLEQKGYDGIVMDDLDGAAKHPHVIVFNSNQIKHVKNDGNFSDSPNIYKSGKEGYYSPANNEIGLSDLGDKSTLMHEVQHAIQGVEDFARGGDFNTVWNVAAKNIEKKYESELARLEKISNDAWGKHAPLQKEYIKLFDDGLKDTPEAQRLLKQMRAFSDEGSRADHEIRELRQAANAEKNAITEETLQENYRKIHGEAEARNVQNRLNLDGKAHPHETFDVNPNETIVSKGDEVSYSRKIEEIKREHPNVERELDESIAAMRKESFNDSNFKDGLISKFDTKEITTQELGKSVNLSDKQLAVLKNDIKNADFKVISDSKIYFDKIGKDGDKKRFFVDIAEDGSLRVDGYNKKDIDSIPVKQSALEELAGAGDAARLKNMSFEVKAAYRNELDPIKKEAILKTAELNKLKKAAQGGDRAAAAKFEEFKAKNLDENGNIKDGLSLC